MKAVQLCGFGGPEQLVPAELPDPRPGPGEVRTEEKLERVRALGAEGGALYTEDDWPQRVEPVDAVVDSVGGVVWPGALEALRPGGRLVNFADTARSVAEVSVTKLYSRYLRIQGTTMGSPREFDALLAHVAEADWRPVIDGVFPLAEAAKAHERLDAPDRFGKVVLDIGGGAR